MYLKGAKTIGALALQSLPAKLINWEVTGSGTPIRLPTEVPNYFCTPRIPPRSKPKDHFARASCKTMAPFTTACRLSARLARSTLPYEVTASRGSYCFFPSPAGNEMHHDSRSLSCILMRWLSRHRFPIVRCHRRCPELHHAGLVPDHDRGQYRIVARQGRRQILRW